MAENKTNASEQSNDERKTLAVKVPNDVHQAVKVLAAITGENIADLVAGAVNKLVREDKRVAAFLDASK